MKQSLLRYALWITCISILYSVTRADSSNEKSNEGQIRQFEQELRALHQAGEKSRSLRQQDGTARALGVRFDKRSPLVRMGLAAEPSVLTQDLPNPKSRRSKIVHHPRDLADEDALPLVRSFHMGLAANPLVITQDLPSTPAQRRRSLGELVPPSTDAAILSTDALAPSVDSVQSPPLNLNTVGLGKSVSLPLYRREISEEDKELHPEIHFQKHLNHALKRHAHFLHKSVDEDVLESNLRKRAESVGWKYERTSFSRRSLVARQSQFESPGFPAIAFAAAKTGAVTKANPVTAANSLGLHIEANDVGYFVEMQVGTPPATFRLVADTGSADLWLHLEDCRNLRDPSRGCNHPTLNSESSTFKRTENPFKITYGTGKVVGVLVEETINMGGLVLNNHAFGGVTRASDEFTGKKVPFDGLLGTAKSVLSNQKVLTPIEAMAKAGTLSGAFVGYALGRVSDGENIGQLTLGGIDQTKFSGNLTIFPNVNKKGFWEGAMEVQVGGKTILTERTGILDTGTTLMVLPAEDAAIVHSNIPGAVADNKGGFRIPCTNTVKVGLSFGGVVFDINPVDLTFQPVGRNLKGQCISGISVGTVGGPTQWLIGDVFLKNVYFATDLTNDQMGLAVINPVQAKNEFNQKVEKNTPRL
ncbi:hypothetical protein PGT21_007972 [Puccinia graminis f. sp. tritici]|uniref:Peptidase A1 domain-containing protein n=2 Tax=Puccinia graminis f. sp. tritici TaxID=56615 RepID=H6QU39_PUCGT|nr:uncharacterized protein PGTG_22265 [Puccinia graminis f. sp. tritici CRL 75-36-700-3]EHS64451.1 hypothetical protein PGTG_22265 [Puccinia graminis f. sp. tritici CRL 75-36-700-3]KAA1088150.1 hypothetical protein PGTUg99_020447 [Puccinia graminis f. sp. tritici]KAA1112738.1 hypothetical protein PGT21_007972 [Puccinia graminis f. sp. tritici]